MTVGAEVYAEPTLVTVIAVTAPPEIVAVAAALDPAPPENVTVGASTYNVPPPATETAVTLSPPAATSVVSIPNTLVGSPCTPDAEPADSAVVTDAGFSDNVYDAPALTTVSVAPGTPARTVAAVFDAIAVIK